MYEVCNRLLRLLPPDELKHVLLLSEEVPLTKRRVLHRSGVRMQYVYFIESGLVSVGAKVGPQEFVEVWLIGSEGLAGIHLALTAKTQPMHRRIVQVGGAAILGGSDEDHSHRSNPVIDRVTVGREVQSIAAVAALGFGDSTTDIDGAGAGELIREQDGDWLNIAEQQCVDRQWLVGCRPNARGQSSGQEFPLVEQQDRMPPARPFVVVGKREIGKQASGLVRQNRSW
ncbi:hypothetical protein AB4853_41120 [Bradyrhizobium sp. 1050_B9_N1_2]|uniref:hypothetical protein n=1 Tax=Bradyrhizobium sp. 1050_B9_N1_2 TaxID=3238688 RepID=UPI003EDC46E3